MKRYELSVLWVLVWPFAWTIWWNVYMQIPSHLWCIECTYAHNLLSIYRVHSLYRYRCSVLYGVRRLLRIVFSTNTHTQAHTVITNLNVLKNANWTRLLSSRSFHSRGISISHMNYELIWNKLFLIRNLSRVAFCCWWKHTKNWSLCCMAKWNAFTLI